MKKTLITLVSLMVFITLGYARTNLVATLSHNGQITQFYGTNALTAAYNAAEEGDIITLSPGQFSFSGSTFKKGITLRGTGIETTHSTYDLAKPYLSIITDRIDFYSKDSNSVTVIEGIRFTSNVYIYNTSSDKGQGTIKFIKNYLSSVQASSTFNETPPNSPVVRFYNNLISSVYFNSYTNPDFKFYNCHLGATRTADDLGENFSAFYNCIITYRGDEYSYDAPFRHSGYLNFYNCIFCNLNTSSSWNYARTLSSTASCSNCLNIDITSNNLFNGIFFNQNNKNINKIADVFKTYNGNNIWHETFELTETAKTTYLGNDGTEIGIQGGVYPYNIKVQYPIITNLSSDTQTTKDGKLNVKIEIDGK